MASLTEAKNLLDPFLSSHPLSSLEEIGKEKKEFKIKKPWGDSSVALIFSDLNDVTEALNNVHLPERYSAIYHKDTKDLEIIYTAFFIPPSHADIKTRKFKFKFKPNEDDYVCEFGPSSDRLLKIAQYVYPQGETLTNYRNLRSFDLYVQSEEAKKNNEPPLSHSLGEPICFWIRNIEWDEDKILNFVTHLNFYMAYYDNGTPSILVHPPANEGSEYKTQERYKTGKFVDHISCRELDDNLLRYWEHSRIGDPIQRFLSAYRIIEYASFFHLDEETRLSIRTTLLQPNALGDLDNVTQQILGAIRNPNEWQKFIGTIARVGSDVLWKAICRNKYAFSQETNFDGGYSIDPLLKKDWKEKDFRVNGISAFAGAVRGIRNALAHGKDQKTSSSITPTAKNYERLLPWVQVMTAIAREVIILDRAV